MEFFLRFWEQAKTLWARLDLGQKAVLITIPSIVMVFFAMAVIWASTPNFVPLFSKLSQTEASSVAEHLSEQAIKYKIGTGGTIMVPEKDKYKARISLAGAGLPQSNRGWELFDTPALGTTQEDRRINTMRAKAGELERTLAQMDFLSSARVHIPMVEKALFAEEESTRTTAVFLDTVRKPSEREIRTIASLVAAALGDNLEPSNVAISDTSGNLLSAFMEEDGLAGLSNKHLEWKRTVENDKRQKAMTLLNTVLGPGNSSIAVDVELDFQNIERSIETYDPDAVLMEETSLKEETSGPASIASGVAGSTGNVTPGASTAGSSPTSHTKSETTNRFAVGKTLENVTIPPGSVKMISISAILNWDLVKATDAEGADTFTREERSSAQLDEIKNAIANAVGINTARGDQITVTQQRFPSSDDLIAAAAVAKTSWIKDLITDPAVRKQFMLGLSILIVLGMIIWMIRLLAKRTAAGIEEAAIAGVTGFEESYADFEDKSAEARGREFSLAELGIKEPGALESMGPEEQRKIKLTEQVKKMAKDKPENASQIIRTWLTEKKK